MRRILLRVDLNIPLANAREHQRFAEAQHWFHYLFDPTDDSDGPTPERFWKVRPFQYTDVKKIEDLTPASERKPWHQDARRSLNFVKQDLSSLADRARDELKDSLQRTIDVI